MRMKNSVLMAGVFAVLLGAVVAKAQTTTTESTETTVQVDTSQCVEREVLLVVKSTRNVHYSEKDEGRLISDRTIKIKDCGGLVLVDKTPAQGSNGSAGRIVCPPSVQDCIRP
ncbi:hypothetical protein [Pseudobdellovibrio exovorus]|uniref:Uncharacterized protein n=1 Tax=Pseudobdellovibrio exovorus JSS TaxID=1184267 RepID=M4VBZ1_9BACT|nr:hypothetical protein [Pseudobdellovibrio exovorus]AGH96758.1 hypothetical protein A11Q_2542 [Pseudobdellovibrio exovorus JSS]